MIRTNRFLIFRQSSLGDVILTLPVIERLREKFPDCQIDYFTKNAYAPLMKLNPHISRVFAFGDSRQFYGKCLELRNGQYDCLIDLQANIRSYILKISLFPTSTLRYKKRRMAREMVVRRRNRKGRVNHTIEAYLTALKPLGVDTSLIPPAISLNPDSIKFASDQFEFPDMTSTEKIIAFCPGAKHPEKMWPAEQYKEVALKLLNDPDIRIIIITSSQDNLLPKLGIENARVFAACDLELPHLAAILNRCALALSNDSGLMHLAEAVGTPALAIFGPTSPRLGFSPSLPGSKVICDDVSCSPCSVHGQKPCYQPEKYCFKNIVPERVVSQIREMLH